MQRDASVDFDNGSSNVATHDRAFEDFLESVSVLTIMLCDSDALDFLILILRGESVLVEGKPYAGVAKLLALVGRPNHSVNVHTLEDLIRTEQNLILEADCHRRLLAEAFQDDGVQALLVFGEEEVQVRSDVDYDRSCRRVDIEFHFNQGELVLHPPQEFDDRPQR